MMIAANTSANALGQNNSPVTFAGTFRMPSAVRQTSDLSDSND